MRAAKSLAKAPAGPVGAPSHALRFAQQPPEATTHASEPRFDFDFARIRLRAEPGRIQRYEAGEHAQFGETGSELTALIDAPASIYTVQAGETPAAIAKKVGVSVSELLDRNKSKVKLFPIAGAPGKTVKGFSAKDTIEIPQVLNKALRDARNVRELSYQAGKGVAGKRAAVKYGQGIAMSGDLFLNPGQIDSTPRDKIENIETLIDRETASAKSGKFIDNADWQRASDQRFIDLALHNESHFAPSDPALVPVTSSSSAPNNESEWEKYHSSALAKSKGGDLDLALEHNAFADHFLTDAFAAGHLFNKLDAMNQFEGHIKIRVPDPKKPKKRKIDPSSVGFFDQVAQTTFVGTLAALYSGFRTVDTYYGFHITINSAGIFSNLLQGVYLDSPDLVAGSVAKAVHDTLNTKKGGVEVENPKGDKWPLSGDKTLNDKTRTIGRKAVAQSQYNVLSAFNSSAALDLPKLFKAVWDYVPHPTSAGAADIKVAVTKGTNPADPSLRTAVSAMVTANQQLILNELTRRRILEPVPP